MRLWGLQRDYIYSFISQPGRVISPACIDEVASGKIGGDVLAGPEAVVREFLLGRLNFARLGNAAEPELQLSNWRVHQALVLSRSRQMKLPFAEGYSTEFKIAFHRDEDHIAKFMRTMCAMANAGGGYIFFGMNDSGEPCHFDSEQFANFDWDAFDKVLESRFEPYIRWEKRIAPVPDDEFLLGSDLQALDTTLLKRLAAKLRVPPEHIAWLDGVGPKRPVPELGVIYVWPSSARVICVRGYKSVLRERVSYVRLRGRDAPFGPDKTIPLSPRASQDAASVIARADALSDLDRRLNRVSSADRGVVPEPRADLFEGLDQASAADFEKRLRSLGSR